MIDSHTHITSCDGSPEEIVKAAEQVGVLGAVPDVTAKQELGRELGCEGDPPAQRSHGALDDVAVVTEQPGGVLGAEGSFQGLRHAAQ